MKTIAVLKGTGEMNGLWMVFLLSVHALCITLYADMIHRGRSRLDRRFLVFAAILPFVGEICLFVSEIGLVPEEPRYVSPFQTQEDSSIRVPWQAPENWRMILNGDEGEARELVLEVINHDPDQHIQVLKQALKSKSSEVSHIAAAQLMKLHQQHEDKIADAEQDCCKMPGNMEALAKWIDAIQAYRISGLLDHAALAQLQGEEDRLLDQYLSQMPHRYDYHAEKLRLALEMGKKDDAVQQAVILTQNAEADASDWNLAHEAYSRFGNEEMMRLFLLKRESIISQKGSDFRSRLIDTEA